MPKMTSVEKIKKLCKETKGVSLHKLEMDLGFCNAYFAKLKRVPAERLYAVARYFNVPYESLLDDDETKKAATDEGDGYDRFGKYAELIRLYDCLSESQQSLVTAQLRELAQLQTALGGLSKSE